MAILYTDYFKKEYKASGFSRSSCICFILLAVALIMPFILVIRTYSKSMLNDRIKTSGA
jgi:hypothetical protein